MKLLLVLDQHAWLIFYFPNSLKRKSKGRDFALLGYIILNLSKSFFYFQRVAEKHQN